MWVLLFNNSITFLLCVKTEITRINTEHPTVHRLLSIIENCCRSGVTYVHKLFNVLSQLKPSIPHLTTTYAVLVIIQCTLLCLYFCRLHTRRHDVIPDRPLQYHRRLHSWTYKLRDIYVRKKVFTHWKAGRSSNGLCNKALNVIFLTIVKDNVSYASLYWISYFYIAACELCWGLCSNTVLTKPLVTYKGVKPYEYEIL